MREFSLKWVIAIPVLITMVLIIEFQDKLVEYAIGAAYQELNMAAKQDIKRTVSGAYQDAFVKNGEMLELIANTSGLKQAMFNNDGASVMQILQDTFASNFVMNGIAEVGIYDSKGAYLASDDISSQRLQKNFQVELNSVAKTKQPYYSVRCSGGAFCLGYSTIPVMLNGIDIGYIVAGFDIKEIFSQYLSSEHIIVSMGENINNSPVQDEDIFQFKLPLVHLPDNVWIRVSAKSVNVKTITYKLQHTLRIADLIGGLSIVIIILYMVSIRTKELKKISEMIVNLGNGNFKRFKDIAKIMPANKLLQVREFSQIRESTLELAGRLDNAVNETVMRKVAENVAAEKKAALSKASRDFEFKSKQLAQEFHDELGQRMVALKFMAVMLKQNEDPQDIAVTVDAISDLVIKMEENISSILDGLHPPLIDALGIVGAISAVVREIEASNRRACQFKVNVTDKLAEADAAIQVTVFRIVQEALTNAIKHSRPKCIEISIRSIRKDNKSFIAGQIENDGSGFDPAAVRSGRGLLGMKERVMCLDGELLVLSSDGPTGTKIKFLIPLV